MTYSGTLFMVAAIILACAFNISQIFIGRVFQGIAVSPAILSAGGRHAPTAKLTAALCRSRLPASLCPSTTQR